MTPELSKQDDRVLFLPLCYADILGHLRRTKIDAALFSVAPPDANGLCSFGTIADFLPELWPYIAVRIALINPAMPRTHGQPGIHFSSLTDFCQAVEPLAGTDADTEGTPLAMANFPP